MRILAHGAPLGGRVSRVSLAVAGLALRGHEVDWLAAASAPGPASAVRRITGLRALTSVRADVVVGGGGAPLRTAACGWVAGCHVMALDLRAEDVERWGALDRWAWQSLHATGLIEERDAPRFIEMARGPDRERIGLWPGSPAGSAADAASPDTEILERACERAIARHRGRAPRPAVFLDRDGTLIRETGYLSDPDAIELLPGVTQALRNLSEAGYPLVVVSNQSGIGRGMFTAARVHEVMARLRQRLREAGVELNTIRFCPHRPEDDCPCRKPRPGLLELAAEDLQLSLRDSLTIGDKRIDAVAGKNAGGRGVLVRTGYGREQEALPAADGPEPDRVCEDLAEAVEWWLEEA